MITALGTPTQATWRSDGGNAPIDINLDRSVKLLGGPALPLPPGVWPVGEGHVVEGVLHQPVFRATAASFVNHTGLPLFDNKISFAVARIDLSDLEAEPTWLPGAQPDPATVAGHYNVALEGSGEGGTQRGPWGSCADIGGAEFLGSFVGGELLIPQFRGANQIYATRLDGSGKAWVRQGWDNYPAFMATRSTEQLQDIAALESYGAAEYWRESYTALGIAGDRLIVERRRQWLSPTVTPNYIDDRLEWTVAGMTGGSEPEYRSYDLDATLLGKWAWQSIGGVNSDIEPHIIDTFQGNYTHEPGNPETFVGVDIGNSGASSIDSCLADALELAGRLRYLGHFAYKTERWIESWDLATGTTLASREQPIRAILPSKNLQGAGTAAVATYSAPEIRAWSGHPSPYWAGPPGNPSSERTYYPPETPLEGYVGGAWGTNPQIGLYYFPDSRFLYPVIAGGNLLSAGLAPTGLYVRGPASGSGPSWRDVRGLDLPPIHVVSCYSKIAPGDRAQTEVALPWPFDPLSLATDGETLYFAPLADSTTAMTMTRQGQNLPADTPDHTLPEWDTEVERVKRVVCWNAATLEDGWELDALDYATTNTKPHLGTPLLHPCCGDRIGNLVIVDAYLLAMVHGANGQRLLEIERASGGVARSFDLADTALDFVSNGVYLQTALLLCAMPTAPWCHDSLLVLGNQLYGITPGGKRWKLI